MLTHAKNLERDQLQARDGAIGRVVDYYFDDRTWSVRYLVVDTGPWLSGRKVLLSPKSVLGRDAASQRISVDLTQEQVRASPDIDTDRPVSRQLETKLAAHYGWPVFWGAGAFGAATYPTPLGGGVLARAGVPQADEPLTTGPGGVPDGSAAEDEGDPHLRSTREVRGYGIEAQDGSIGHVDDFLIEDRAWQILYLVVATRNWWPGRKVIVAPDWITRVSWTDQAVHVDLTRDAIKGGPEYDPSGEVSRDYVKRLHEHYRRPHRDSW
jgi:uncharacterized protein YrrD